MVLRPYPHNPLAVRRDLYVLTIFFVATHIADEPLLPALQVRRPYLLFRFLDFAGGISHMSFAAYFGSSSKEHGLSVRREFYGKDVLTIVALVVRHLAGGEVGRVGDPHIPLALAVKHPGN